ncbi:RdgB/HAM1 family non-canonical purine NTP pyrophosphatase [Actinocrinis puniceicyclus]|uniref:dITP/XTP pyrophosphatase n=1 Tax=Actinocrinis puniceicyclus TaxID=977794 RepID=A0A8J7WV97_9ACTN|nr:RdgB/HAM1 family non-canonical purine NTP pyrophosphatase [Actinocrinis puniceicyclus]
MTRAAGSSPVCAPRVVLATRNRHKIEELHAILAASGVEAELLGVAGFPDLPDVAETGVTFAENALLKAVDVAARTGLPAVADDSGLCVDVLGGAPGIFSARWAGRHGDDKANLDLLLAQLRDVADEHRQAHFACAAALALPDGRQVVREGRIDGALLHAPRGSNGFGYDPIFLPDGYDRTTAEMAAGEKNAISHRTRAFQALAKDLAALL